MTGVKAGTLHQGTFNASLYNFLEVCLGLHLGEWLKSVIFIQLL